MSDSCWFTNGLSCSPNTRLAPHQGRVDHLLQPLSQVSAQAKGKTLQCASPWFISPISIVMRILQQNNLGGRGKTKARLACDVISVFLAMISLDGAQLLQQ